MDALDLTKNPPRSPRVRMLGLVFLARTIDKVRAELPGGNPGAYFVENSSGMSAYLLRKIGVEISMFRKIVESADNESDVINWLATHAKLDDTERLNAGMETAWLGALSAERRTLFNFIYPGADLLPDDTLFFDIFERDDEISLSAIHAEERKLSNGNGTMR